MTRPLVLLIVSVTVALAGALAARSIATDPVRNGLDVRGTILSRSGEHAVVRFTTVSGSVATTTIRICHHQAYNVGGIVPIRYDRKAPSDAAERDMLPNPNLGLPAAVLLLGTLAAAVVARRRRSQPTLRDDDTPEIEAEPADDESMEPVLVGADA